MMAVENKDHCCMLRKQRFLLPLWCGIALHSLFVSGSLVAKADQPNDAGIEFFENRIRPVLVKHCYKCHSVDAKSAKGGLLLDTRASTLKGGETGPAVVMGEVDESLLIDAIRYESFEMPPDGRLPDNVIEDFVTWVKLGAPDPRVGAPGTPQPVGNADDFWAFQRPQRAPVPDAKNRVWAETPIDRFVMDRRQAAGLSCVQDADRRSLVRRVYFDLIGLPPTPGQVQSFLDDGSPTPQALQRVVDQLLESQHFGERWGRHWLDIARYAESTGKEWNWAHPEAWRYRDYVIESFNKDKPYDQFLREQIAGDLLPTADSAQRDEFLVATGFLAIGPKAVSIGNDEEFGLELADEQINTVSRAVLGLTVGCARCHDHKFDPISAEDYYALTGIFLSTETLFGTSASGYKGRNNKQGTPLLPIGPDGQRLHSELTKYQESIKQLTDKLTEQRGELEKLSDQPGEDKGQQEEAGDSTPVDHEVDAQISQLRTAIEKHEQELEELNNNPPPKADYAMGVRDRDQPQDCQLRLGGEIDQKGDPVPRGFLSSLQVDDHLRVNADQSGRKELAEWLSHPENPLTARVMVNRIWQQLFGRGLVTTADNFGWLGKRPSHPLLLDHLAVSFMEDDWSVKRMIRRIMLSRTYRLSTSYDAQSASVDPDNELLWRMTPRRLQAEEIRDAILTVSGGLHREPLQGSPAVGRLDPGWIGNEVKESAFKDYTHNHRSIYLPIVRDSIPEVLQTFDYPDPAEVTGRREVSVVPAQALFMMNSEFVVAQSRATAERLIYAAEDRAHSPRLDRAYQLVIGRSPSATERQRAEKMIEDVDRILQKRGHDSLAAERDALAALVQSLFSSGEFLYLF